MPIGFGILGAGMISRHFVSALKHVPEARVVNVASRTKSRASAFASEFKVSRWCADYEELVSDPDVDVVYVSTPAGLHHEHSLLAIAAGKAVLCEKPFATTAAQAREVVSAARKKQVFCMEAMWMRFLPLMRELDVRVKRGDIGTIRALSADLCFSIPYADGSRYYDPELGGGSLLDLGIYPVSLTSMLLGQPTNVIASKNVAPSGVDDQMSIVLKYPEAIATLTCGFTGTGRNGAYIMGSSGFMTIDPPIYASTGMCITKTETIHKSKGNTFQVPTGKFELNSMMVELRRRLGPTLKPILRRNRERVRRHFRGFGYQYEATEVVRCLGVGKLESPIMPLDETIAVMEILDIVREAANT